MTREQGHERQDRAAQHRAARAEEVRHIARLHEAQLQQQRDELAEEIAEDGRHATAQEVRS